MFRVSIFTMPFGLSEPIFVPIYWHPPSLFDLATRTGFDIESLIFCFALGGIATVLYESVFSVRHRTMTSRERHKRRHQFHRLILFSPILFFVALYTLTNLNPIYSASIAMLGGALAMIYRRLDLFKKVVVGACVFLFIYFVFFLVMPAVYPDFVTSIWNLPLLSGILIAGVPIEEFFFAFTFGMLWSGLYEHILWLRVTRLQG